MLSFHTYSMCTTEDQPTCLRVTLMVRTYIRGLGFTSSERVCKTIQVTFFIGSKSGTRCWCMRPSPSRRRRICDPGSPLPVQVLGHQIDCPARRQRIIQTSQWQRSVPRHNLLMHEPATTACPLPDCEATQVQRGAPPDGLDTIEIRCERCGWFSIRRQLYPRLAQEFKNRPDCMDGLRTYIKQQNSLAEPKAPAIIDENWAAHANSMPTSKWKDLFANG